MDLYSESQVTRATVLWSDQVPFHKLGCKNLTLEKTILFCFWMAPPPHPQPCLCVRNLTPFSDYPAGKLPQGCWEAQGVESGGDDTFQDHSTEEKKQGHLRQDPEQTHDSPRLELHPQILSRNSSFLLENSGTQILVWSFSSWFPLNGSIYAIFSRNNNYKNVI